MSQKKKILLLVITFSTILLGVLSFIIAGVLRDQNLQTQTGAQNVTILNNCNPNTNTCTVASGVCNPSKVFLHFCNDIKRDNQKCVSDNPIEVPSSPFSPGQSIDLNDYLNNVNCGTVQMYLELDNSGVDSLGACGTTIKRFASACNAGENNSINQPVSFPVSFPASFPQQPPTSNNVNNNVGQQIANPQFSITSSLSGSCDQSNQAVLRYTITVTNISTVSGTISKIEEVIDQSYINANIVPLSISTGGTLQGNKITWVGSSTDRNFSAGQTKTYTYELRIPNSLLGQFNSNRTSTSTVTYDTSVAIGNVNTFVLNSKHSCPITTTNLVQPTTPTLPSTSIEDGFRLLILGSILIVLGFVSFRYRIGENFILKLTQYKPKKIKE